MKRYLTNYTPYDYGLNIETQNKSQSRLQTDYEYNGALDVNEDPADYYAPIKAVSIA